MILPSVAYLLFMLGGGISKQLFLKDLQSFFYSVNLHKKYLNDYLAFYRLMVLNPAFRNVFYYRLGALALLIQWSLPPVNTLEINTPHIGGGIHIQHGYSTLIYAKSIGENVWINQNVTIGWRNQGNPTIGNRVQIGVGALILGPITIGDDVHIGAGAIVIKDVPSNTTIVSPQSFICRHNGQKVHEAL
jgi:serine O-acetyltransferase